MNPPYILTLDIGSSSVRATVYDSSARAIPETSTQIKYDFRTTPDGGSEMDADVLLAHCFAAIDATLARFPAGQPIAAVASDCFTLSILGVSGDGNAVTPIYTYADSRGAREVAELRAKFDERAMHQRVGTMFHTSYLPARLLWLARNRADEFKRAKCWMSFGEYLYFKLLGVRAVSHSIASWTGLLNRTTRGWDQELISALPIPLEQLSPVDSKQSAEGRLHKEFASRWGTLKDAVWIPTIGDGAAANLGSGCVDSSRVAVTVGTSSAVRVALPPRLIRERVDNTRSEGAPHLRASSQTEYTGTGDNGQTWRQRAPSPRRGEGLELPFGLWSYRVTKEIELIGGALSEGGNVYAWINQILRVNAHEGDHEGRPYDLERELAQLEPDAHGLTVLPFLAGERAPNWNADARGAILGLTLNTRPIEILRAGMEAVAYRLGIVYEMVRGVVPEAKEIVASGGALEKSPTWVQMIADGLNARVIASAEAEATSRGCALIALKELGLIESFGDVSAALGHVYEPDLSRHEIYSRAMERQKKWYNLLVKEKR